MTRETDAGRAVPGGLQAMDVAPTDDLNAVRALGVANGIEESDTGGVIAAWAARTGDGAMVLRRQRVQTRGRRTRGRLSAG